MRFDYPNNLKLRKWGSGSHTKAVTSFLAALSFVVSSTTFASTVDIGPDQEITVADSALLIGVVTADSFPSSKKILPVEWSQAGGPGTVTFGNDKESLTTARFSETGDYILRLTVDGNVSDEVAIKVISSAPNTIRVPEDHSTIQQGIDAASDGDLVLVSPGTYQERIEISKTITLASTYYTTGDTSKIDETIIKNPTDNLKSLIKIKTETGYETQLIGFKIEGGGDGVKIKGLAKIISNKWVDQESDAVDFTSTGKGLVQNNTMTGAGDDAVDADNLDVLIENNLMLNNGEGVEVRLVNTNSQRVVIIRNNIIKNSEKTGLQFIDDEADSSISDTAGLLIIDHNLITNSTHSGLAFMEGANTSDHEFVGADLLERVFLFNNTFIGNEYGVTGSANLIALNNIFADTVVAAINNVGGDSVVAHNLFWNNGTHHQDSNFDANNLLSSNPLLDANGKLQEGSPAIDVGTADYSLPSGEVVLNLPSTAYKGAAPDLGAYESDVDSGGGNLPPVAIDDSGSVTSGSSVTLSVMDNDSDSDGDTLTISDVSSPTHGTTVISGNNIVYTADSGYEGDDSFNYTIDDGQGGTATATVNVSLVVIPNNDPVAVDDSTSVMSGDSVTISVIDNDSDDDGDTLTISDVSSPTHGTAVISGNDIVYTADSGYGGEDSFNYTIDDGQGGTATATVTVVVNEMGTGGMIESRISAGSDDAEENVGTNKVSLGSSDLELVKDGSETQKIGMRFTGINIPAGANITHAYIQFKADETNSETTSLTINGEAIDHAPTFSDTEGDISNRALTTNSKEWTPAEWNTKGEEGLNQRTPDIKEIIQEIVNRPGRSEGDAIAIIMSGTGKRVAVSYNGDEGGAPVLRIEYSTTSMPLPPTANNDSAVTNEGDLVIIDVASNDTDPNGNLDITSVQASGAGNGSLISNANGTVSYIPNSGFVGIDSFTYKIFDKDGLFDEATVTVTVNGSNPNRPPIAQNDNAVTTEGTKVTINVASNDSDPDDNLNVSSVSSNSAGNGLLADNGNGTVSYTPNAGFTGTDHFDYEICDTDGLCDVATVTVVVNEVVAGGRVESRISASSDDAEEKLGSSGEAGKISLGSSDLELVKEGTKTQKIGMRFTGIDIPAGANITQAYIQFKADETDSEATALTINGEAIDHAPTFSKIEGNISDRTLTNNSKEWTPAAWNTKGEEGLNQRTPDITDIIQEIVNRPGRSEGDAIAIIMSGTGKRVAESYDGDLGGAPVLRIEYNTVSVPLPPIANNDSADTTEGEEVTIDVAGNDTDPNGNLDVTTVHASGATHGLLADNADGTVSYTPDAGFTGTDTFTYEICDTGGLCSTATVSVNVVDTSATGFIDVQVSDEDDDVEEHASGKMKMNSSDLELVFDRDRKQQVGMRFNAIDIPQGAIITNAYIQFTVDEIDDDLAALTMLTIMGEASDNAAAFESSNSNLSSRQSTTMTAPWTPKSWTSKGDSGMDQRTSDISSVIQEIVDRQGWTGGNSMVISITGSGKRVAMAYDKKPSAAPKLHIEFQFGEND